MLARPGARARHTLDMNLYGQQGNLDEAENALCAAALLDLGDQFRFALDPGRQIVQEERAQHIPVVAYLGVTQFATFHVDLVVAIAMTAVPKEVSPLLAVDVPGLVRSRYRAYPVVDHVADKVCAMLEVHHREGQPAVQS